MVKQLEEEITIPYMDIFSFVQLEDFYKTDIHLKQEAYDDVIKEISKNFNFSLQNDISWKKQSYDKFYGATYAKGAFLSKPEKLNYYTNYWIENAQVWHLEYGYKKVYDVEKLESTDSYSIFLSGPSALIEIYNPTANDEKELILFRDSFSSSLAPLLIPYYRKITLIDLRYISMEEVAKRITFVNQDVLFLYNTILLNESNLLKVKIS